MSLKEKIIPQDTNITFTKDYGKFIFLDSNRDIRKNPNLFNSMKKYGWLTCYPLTCTKDFEIIDGQHRLDYAMNHKIVVPFVINNRIDKYDIPLIQCGASWTMEDYLKHFSERGYSNYIKVKNCLDFGNMKIGVFLNCFGSSKKGLSTYKWFRKGEVVLTTYDFLKIDNEITRLNEIKKHLDKSRRHINACLYLSVKSIKTLHTFISTYENYNHDRFMHALKLYPDNLLEVLKFQNVENIIRGCEILYNKNLKSKEKRIRR